MGLIIHYKLRLPGTVANKHRAVPDHGDSPYATAVILRSLLRQVAPATQWHWRRRDLSSRYPGWPPGAMGFPAGWQQNSFWDFPHTP